MLSSICKGHAVLLFDLLICCHYIFLHFFSELTFDCSSSSFCIFFLTLSISIRPRDTVYVYMLHCQMDCKLRLYMFIGHFPLLGQQVPDATFSLIMLAGRAFSPLFILGKLEDNHICETCLDLYSLLSLSLFHPLLSLPSPLLKQYIINACASLPQTQYYSSDVGHLSG